jgi:D-alanyl-lipoteichoic acid acyltransferase DltB (MBOAT superfamily)
MAAAGFTLQIYFDFSGYTDMALGIARFFGIKLPPNFNSPLRASSIIEFWQRWHMTLTRFLTAYIYNPLSLSLTRRRLANGQPAFGGQNKTTVGAFVQLLVFPILLTMFVSGVWHGAGYLFIAWGVLHGIYLCVNHGWRLTGAKLWHDKAAYSRFMQPVGFVLTFVCVAISMVIFRSPTTNAAAGVLKGMIGLNGTAQPAIQGLESGVDLKIMGIWTLALGFIAVACPNTLQLLNRYEPALGWKPEANKGSIGEKIIAWDPSLAWAVVVSAVAAVAILYLGGQSEFLYWQF